MTAVTTRETHDRHCHFLRALNIGLLFFLLIGCGGEISAYKRIAAVPSVDGISCLPVRQNAEWTRSWWKARHDAKVARACSGDVDLLMIGDSITHGWEKAGAEVWNHYYAHRRAVNLGFSGDRTEHVLWRLVNGELEGLSPKLAILMIGTNDSRHGRTPENTAQGIRCITEALRFRLPRTKILLLAIFPRGATSANRLRQINRRVNALIQSLDDGRHVFFLNINDAFLDGEHHLSVAVMPDLLHPGVEGYRRWAAAMEPFVHRMMGDKAVSPTNRRSVGRRLPTDAVTGTGEVERKGWFGRVRVPSCSAFYFQSGRSPHHGRKATHLAAGMWP